MNVHVTHVLTTGARLSPMNFVEKRIAKNIGGGGLLLNKDKVILDLCGGTGAWSRPYAEHGYVVRVITLPEYDVRTYELPDNVYGILAAPPCPHFSFCRTNAKSPRDLRGAMELVEACLKIIWECQYRIVKDVQKRSPLVFWALENPNGMLKWFLGHPVLEFQPYEYGDDYKKKTHIWGYFKMPVKTPILCTKPKFDKLHTKEIHPECYGKYDRQTRRSITPKGFATAFRQANLVMYGTERNFANAFFEANQ